MEAKDVIQLLRLQRHDLMNDLQIVHGYLSMGKTDKVKLKVNEIIQEFQKERLLMNLNCPNFALWLIQVNWFHNNIRFTYDIHTITRDLSKYDSVLASIGNTVLESLNKAFKEETALVEGTIEIIDRESEIDFITTIHGQTINYKEFENEVHSTLENVSVHVEELNGNVKYRFSILA